SNGQGNGPVRLTPHGSADEAIRPLWPSRSRRPVPLSTPLGRQAPPTLAQCDKDRLHITYAGRQAGLEEAEGSIPGQRRLVRPVLGAVLFEEPVLGPGI